jgi:hypothetical protein
MLNLLLKPVIVIEDFLIFYMLVGNFSALHQLCSFHGGQTMIVCGH